MPADTGGRTTAQVAEDARRIVGHAIVRRGGTVREVRRGRRWELHGTGPQGSFRIRVVSRRRGDWQSSIREGDGAGDPDRHWVFVDLRSDSPRFWVLPELEVVAGIRERHRAYLDRNGGHRVQNDNSLHCKITTTDVEAGAGRWDLVGFECS